MSKNCEFCGTYATRCHEDRRGGTYCAITGRRVLTQYEKAIAGIDWRATQRLLAGLRKVWDQ